MIAFQCAAVKQILLPSRWDRAVLAKHAQGQQLGYGDEDFDAWVHLNEAAITHYVQHPVLIEPPAEEAPPEAMPLMLTKKVTPLMA